MERLSTLKEKTKGKVVEIIGDTHFQSRIISIGITVGSDVEVIQNYKKQPILIYCRDTMIAVNKIEAESINRLRFNCEASAIIGIRSAFPVSIYSLVITSSSEFADNP